MGKPTPRVRSLSTLSFLRVCKKGKWFEWTRRIVEQRGTRVWHMEDNSKWKSRSIGTKVNRVFENQVRTGWEAY